MKKIYHINVSVIGEQDFFFDSKGKILAYWDCNDANYRSEYMNPLLNKLGYEVIESEWNDKRFLPSIKEALSYQGVTDQDFIDHANFIEIINKALVQNA